MENDKDNVIIRKRSKFDPFGRWALGICLGLISLMILSPVVMSMFVDARSRSPRREEASTQPHLARVVREAVVCAGNPRELRQSRHTAAQVSLKNDDDLGVVKTGCLRISKNQRVTILADDGHGYVDVSYKPFGSGFFMSKLDLEPDYF